MLPPMATFPLVNRISLPRSAYIDLLIVLPRLSYEYGENEVFTLMFIFLNKVVLPLMLMFDQRSESRNISYELLRLRLSISFIFRNSPAVVSRFATPFISILLTKPKLILPERVAGGCP